MLFILPARVEMELLLFGMICFSLQEYKRRPGNNPRFSHPYISIRKFFENFFVCFRCAIIFSQVHTSELENLEKIL